MSSEIVRQKPGQWLIEAQRFRQPSVRTSTSQLGLFVRPGDVVDVPRICAVHDMPWAARYVMNGGLEYAQSIRVTKQIYHFQYEENRAQRVIPSADLDETETCPWCGASGMPIRCGRCKNMICSGRTVRRHFRCTQACGADAQLVSGLIEDRGVDPRGMR